MLYRVAIFVVLNFLALAIGAKFTGEGVPSEWYQNLNKAPWTPPGWVFGAAWTVIMILFSFYLAFLWEVIAKKSQFLIIYSLAWSLNLVWNPIFFHYQEVFWGLITISLLSLLIVFYLIRFNALLKWKSILIGPYILWLMIATSLNAYILFNN
jgi:translocator protein